LSEHHPKRIRQREAVKQFLKKPSADVETYEVEEEELKEFE
jgi:hypothetical protein